MKWRDLIKGLIICEGLAGSGKTYSAVKHFKSLGRRVLVVTATNQTARALAKSLGVDVKTICSGCFTSNPPVQFYVDFKDMSDYDVIIIDEALLAGTARVFDFIEEFRTTHLIVVCTDPRQMLPDLNNEGVLLRYTKIRETADDIMTFTEIYRTNDDDTKEMYRFLYERAEKDDKLYSSDDLKTLFRYVPLDEINYNKNLLILCVSNDVEDTLYMLWNVSNSDEHGNIVKGASASQQSQNRRLMVVSHNQAKELGLKSWYEADNIMSICRGQGITADYEVCLAIREGGLISDKGIYTAFTRCRHKDKFFVTTVDVKEDFCLETLHGLPVKTLVDYQMNKTKAELMKAGTDGLDYILNSIHGVFENDTETTYYNKKNIFTKDKKCIHIVDRNTFVFDNKKYSKVNGKYMTQIINRGKKYSRVYKNGETNINPYKLAEKMAPINYMDEVFAILEESGYAPTIDFYELPYGRHKERQFEFDMMKAYPHAFYLSPLPVPGILSRTYNPDMLNWYFVKSGKRCNLVTERYATLLKEYTDLLPIEIKFAFATPFRTGCVIGDIFKEMMLTKEGIDNIYSAIRVLKKTNVVTTPVEIDGETVYEEREEVTETEEHYYEWGWFLKDYMNKAKDCYVRNEKFCWQLLLIAIKSEMTYQTLKASIAVKGVVKDEGLNKDAFYFENLTYEIIQKIDEALDEGWEYRINSTLPMPVIKKNEDCKYKDGRYCVHKNFNIETKAERARRLSNERKKAYRARQKELTNKDE